MEKERKKGIGIVLLTVPVGILAGIVSIIGIHPLLTLIALVYLVAVAEMTTKAVREIFEPKRALFVQLIILISVALLLIRGCNTLGIDPEKTMPLKIVLVGIGLVPLTGLEIAKCIKDCTFKTQKP